MVSCGWMPQPPPRFHVSTQFPLLPRHTPFPIRQPRPDVTRKRWNICGNWEDRKRLKNRLFYLIQGSFQYLKEVLPSRLSSLLFFLPTFLHLPSKMFTQVSSSMNVNIIVILSPNQKCFCQHPFCLPAIFFPSFFTEASET